jgi:hypothetical protein
MTSQSSDRPVSALRARMIEDMSVRGFSEKTRHDYIRNAGKGRSDLAVNGGGAMGPLSRAGPIGKGLITCYRSRAWAPTACPDRQRCTTRLPPTPLMLS